MHALLLPLIALGASRAELLPEAQLPPLPGEVALPLETVYWGAEGPERRVPTLEEQRGDVVLVHTWGYYCGPCMKEGVPYVVDLMRANADRGLSAFSITVPISDGRADDYFVEVGHEMGMKHPLGTADGFGEMTPYVNMNVNKGLTWCFVIGREGGVRWVGDPSIDDEPFLEAVRAALFEEAAPPLDPAPPEPLAKAIAAYVAGDLTKARAEAEKVAGKLARKRHSEETTAARAYTTAFLERIDAHRRALEQRLDDAWTARDAAEFVTAARTLRARFPKTESADHAEELERAARADRDFAPSLDAQTRWDRLLAERPALFPARDDKASRRYAKELASWVESAPEGRPGLAQARELLAAFDSVGGK